MRSLLTFLIAAAALAAVYAGPFLLLPLVIAIYGTFGGDWGFVALGGALAACAGVLWALFRFADRRTAHLDSAGGPAPRDRLFCLMCGAPAALDEVVCGLCGGTRFGLGAPSGAQESAKAAPTAAPSALPLSWIDP